MTEKRPRLYAAEIAAMRTRAERAEALGRVPEHLQELTIKHVYGFRNEREWLPWVKVLRARRAERRGR